MEVVNESMHKGKAKFTKLHCDNITGWQITVNKPEQASMHQQAAQAPGVLM